MGLPRLRRGGLVIESEASSDNKIVDITTSPRFSVVDNKGDSTNTVCGFGEIALPAGGAVVGERASLSSDPVQEVVVGAEASSANRRNTVTGWDAEATGESGTAIGRRASANGFSTAIRNGTTTTAPGALALGQNVMVGTGDLGRIGVEQLVFGGQQNTIADADLANGELTIEADEATSQFKIRYKDSSGTVQTGTITFD